MGGCHSAACNSVAQDIWDWPILHHNWLSASFIPGKQSVSADRLSRACNASTKWQLSPLIFMQLSSIFGVPSVDMFASQVNHQLRTYISWHPDPGTTYVDAFTVDWAMFTNGYAFPPFCLVTRCLQKIVQDRTSIIIVVPLWPTQVWFSHLVSLLIMPPTSVPSGEGSLDKSCVGNDTSVEFETNVNGLQGIRRGLLDCQISSNITDVIINSWRPGTQKQYSVYVNRWTQFCDEKQINSISPSVTHVLQFLQMLYERDLSYSTINTARAALNCYLLDHKLHNTPYTLSTHPFVNRYMKGVFNSRTPTLKYSDTWDVKIVLDFIKNWHPLTDLALKHMTYKLVLLLALTTGQRCQTLASLDTQTMTKKQQNSLFFA